MPKIVGYIGYGFQKESAPGVWTDVIEEKRYFGDIMWDNRRFSQNENVNDDLIMNDAFSLVADAFANENFMNIRYFKWNNYRWTVTAVEVEPPRLKLYVGSVYNGPTPD